MPIEVKGRVAPIALPVSSKLETGLVLASKGRNEEAIIELDRYIKMEPNDPMAYVVRGDSYDDMGQCEKAIDDYSKSIELEPKLAEAYAEIGDFEKSIKDFNKAIELYPENARYYFNRSLTYDKSGDIDKTIDDCTEAIELDTNWAKAYYNRGIAYSEKGDYDKAISDYNKVIKLQSEFTVDAYFNRGVAYQLKGEHKKALEDFKWVRKHVSDRGDIEVVEQKIRELTEGRTMGLVGKKKTNYHQAALDIYLESISKYAENQFEYSQWYAWRSGAIALFEGLKDIPKFRVTPDSLDRAKLLLELGIQAMISFWYHNVKSQQGWSDEEKEMAMMISLENVQTFLGISSEDSIKLYLGFDKELQRVLNRERGWIGYYTDMFYQRFRECITGEQIVDWSKLQLPIEMVYDAWYKDRHRCLQIEESMQAFRIIALAGKFMFDEFRRLCGAK